MLLTRQQTARITLELLRDLFLQQVISRNSDVNWPQRSPDLTATDFFLWGYLKSKIYGNKPETLEQLQQNIRYEIIEITLEMCENVMKMILIKIIFFLNKFPPPLLHGCQVLTVKTNFYQNGGKTK